MQDKPSDASGWPEGHLWPEQPDKPLQADTDYVADDQPVSDHDVIAPLSSSSTNTSN